MMLRKQKSYDVNSSNNKEEKTDKQALGIAVIYHSLSANTQNALDKQLQALDLAGVNIEGVALKSFRHNSLALIKKHDSFKQIEDALAHGYKITTTTEQQHNLTSTLATNKERSLSSVHVCDCSTIKVKPVDGAKPIGGKREQPPEVIINDHIISMEEFLAKYEVDPKQGLTKEQAEFRLQRDGVNVLKQKRKQSEIVKYLKELLGGYNFVMWMATVLAFLCYAPLGGDTPDINNAVLSGLLLLAIFLQSTFSYCQHRRSNNLMSSFEKMMPHVATVLRDGHWVTLNTWELVVGDVIRLATGEKIPADVRIIECSQASVEKSALTGEPEPVRLNVNSTDLNPYETKNIGMFGSSLLEGTATGIVFQTGERTVLGKIAEITMNTKSDMTTMQREINYFAIVIGSISIGTSICSFVAYKLFVQPKEHDFLTLSGLIVACVGVVVSFFPEGLPIAVTMTLTLIAKKMKKINVLVKKMPIIETLGSTTVIASDKTGTITQNRMSLSHIWINNLHDESFLGPKIDPLDKHYRTMLTLAGLCNKAIAEENEEKKKVEFIGLPTECGILKAACDYVDMKVMRAQFPIEFEIPFNSRYKYHLSGHKLSSEASSMLGDAYTPEQLANKTHICIVKGAPEVISELCEFGFDGSKQNKFSTIKENVLEKNRKLASAGERVLAIAYTFVSIMDNNFDVFTENNLPSDFCFYGLLSLIDPPRDGVADAVTKCHDGGIKVMMVTGDHPLTAVSIAQMVNIITNDKNVKNFEQVKVAVETYPEEKIEMHCQCRKISIFGSLAKLLFSAFLPKHPTIIAKKYQVTGGVVICGKEISEFELEHWDYVLSHNEIVFARTTPQHKLAIVQQLQRRGEIVTVTGDGVNDAPALKQADIGIAMAIAGTDVSKEAAKIIIMDDNFSTIVNGIEQGRLLFDNLKKVIGYLLPAGCFAEIIPVLLYLFCGVPLPLTTLQMVIVCLFTDTLGSISIIYEYPESNLMKRKPRNAAVDHLISFSAILKIYFQTGMLQLIIAFVMYVYTMTTYNVDVTQLLFAYGKWNVNGTFAGVDYNTRQEALRYAQTAYFVSLVMTQLINLLTVRTRFQTIFKQRFRPIVLLFMLGEVSIVILFCYITPLHPYLGSVNAQWYHFLFPLLLGLSIFLVDELKKLLVRKFPKTCLSNLIW